jgi:hypothetical protein
MAGILIGVDVAEDGTSTTVYGEKYADGTFRITHMSKTPATPAKGIVHKWKPLSLAPRFQYGDPLVFADQDPEQLWAFMFVAEGRETIRVMVTKCPDEDDQWSVGDIIDAGTHELERSK